MQNCSLYLPTSNSTDLKALLQQLFASCTVKFDEPKGKWSKAHISKKRGWFKKDRMTISLLSFDKPDSFVPMMQGMMNFITEINANNPKVQSKLMVKVQHVQSTLGISTDTDLELFRPELFQLIQRLNGFAFVDGKAWVTPEEKVILTIDGQSEINDLDISDAQVQLALASATGAVATSSSQIQRKKKSLLLLQQQGIPTIDHLPPTIDIDDVVIPTKTMIAQRAIAVSIAAIKAEGLEQEIIEQVIEHFGAHSFFSKEEAIFIREQQPSKEDLGKFSWRYECLLILLWSLNLVETLDFPSEICDVASLVSIIQKAGSFEQLLDKATVRNTHQILDQADLIYRMNWACVNARVKQQPTPANMHPGIVYGRHYALNWLIGYQNLDWDNMRTDT